MFYHKRQHVLLKFPQILESACGEGDADICKYEPYVQGVDTAQSNIPSKIAVGKNLRPSRQVSEEDNMNGH